MVERPTQITKVGLKTSRKHAQVSELPFIGVTCMKGVEGGQFLKKE